jgi:hypothetical protein
MTTSARKAPARKTPARKAPARKAPASKTATRKSSAPKAPVVARPPAPQATSAPTPKSQTGKSEAPPEKSNKVKKPKMVRDSFTIPKAEYACIDSLKRRAAPLGREPKKSELLRAGLMLLNKLDDPAFAAALAAVPTIKTGRPKS